MNASAMSTHTLEELEELEVALLRHESTQRHEPEDLDNMDPDELDRLQNDNLVVGDYADVRVTQGVIRAVRVG